MQNGGRKLKVAEVFYTLQGEGGLAGSPFIFVRLAGCNMTCEFCDTDHRETQEIPIEAIPELADRFNCKRILWTGGEPLLQLDAEVIEYFGERKFFQAIETNGSMPIPEGLDYVSISPKLIDGGWGKSSVAFLSISDTLHWPNEIRICVPEMGWLNRVKPFPKFPALRRYLSPNTETEEYPAILKECIEFCLANPAWSLSVQQHKVTWKIK